MGHLQPPPIFELHLWSMVLAFVMVRHGLRRVLSRLAKHRGISHSLPTCFVWGLATYLYYPSHYHGLRVLMAGAVTVGFLSHLLLDELCSVDLKGARVNKAFGTAIKLWAPSAWSTLAMYTLLAYLTWLTIQRWPDNPTSFALPALDLPLAPRSSPLAPRHSPLATPITPHGATRHSARSLLRWEADSGGDSMRRLIVLGLVLASVGQGDGLERVGRLADPEIREASGIVRSRRHPGIFWVHNDSGNAPTLFAVRRDGSLVRSYPVAVPNVDWEDIATDDAGHLYLGDIGNNKLVLPLRAIYRLDEPDPSRPAPATPLPVNRVSYYTFPTNDRFDAESLFVTGGQAFVVSKRLDGQPAEVYRIKLNPPAPLLRPALPERVATLPGCVEPATGADLSPDGKRLAVVTNSAARVYEVNPAGGWRLVATARFTAPDVEAICWDGNDLILASEDRSIYRIAEPTWTKAKREPAR